MMLVDNDVPSPPLTINSEFLGSPFISSVHKCSSAEAKMLCIFNLPQKVRSGGEYDIGGTYSEDISDLWFYFTTSVCPGSNYLLNLFVCHRRVGNFSIAISDSKELPFKPTELSGRQELSNTLTWQTFKSAKPNEVYYIKTLSFTDKSLKALEINKYFLVPINIAMNTTHTINHDVIKYIKCQHDISDLLAKKEKADFTLVSASGNKYPVHKIMLVAHSPVLRKIIKDTENETFIDIQDKDMDMLLQYMYTGTIKDIPNQDSMNLLRIAEKFQLQGLFLLTQYALGEQICIENAVEVALISQKYKLEQLQQKVFCFIRNNRKVMQTKSWKELNDVELTKQLIEHIYAGDE